MPPQSKYPGVYVEEVSSGSHTISGVATSNTAFIGRTSAGAFNQAIPVASFADFERSFGGLVADQELGYAVQQFFVNGGRWACVTRVSGASGAEFLQGLHSL